MHQYEEINVKAKEKKRNEMSFGQIIKDWKVQKSSVQYYCKKRRRAMVNRREENVIKQ